MGRSLAALQSSLIAGTSFNHTLNDKFSMIRSMSYTPNGRRAAPR
jgi:hypothetical protein